MINRKALKRAVYRYPLSGWRMILLGALITLAWTLPEIITRYEGIIAAADWVSKLKEENQTVTNQQILNALLNSKERAFILKFIYTCGCALFALIAAAFMFRLTPSILMIPCCALIATYDLNDSTLLSMLNVLTTAKLASACVIALGAGVNIIVYYKRKEEYIRKLKRKRARALAEQRNQQSIEPRAKSLIPKRISAPPPKRR